MKRLLLLIVCLMVSATIYAQNTKVYSCAYDGYINIRQQPSAQSAKLGQFRNGPEGAILLEDLGTWIKIKCGNITGYVVKRHTQETPTIAYNGNVTADWLQGVWPLDWYIYCIYNNGYWESGYNFTFLRGSYILQNNEIKLVAEWRLKDADPWADIWEKVDPNDPNRVMIFQIDEQMGTINNKSKSPYYNVDDECKDYPGFTSLTLLQQSGKRLAEFMRNR